jgi:hypothetical protein
MAAKSKRPTFAGASKKLPEAGRAGVDRAKGDHRRAEAKDARHKATFDLSPELMAELRVASAMSGETLASLAEQGLQAELQRLRDEFMDGHPFPMQRKTRRGRPAKA